MICLAAQMKNKWKVGLSNWLFISLSLLIRSHRLNNHRPISDCGRLVHYRCSAKLTGGAACLQDLSKREMFGDHHHNQTLFGDQNIFTVWPPCLVLFDRVYGGWKNLKSIKHSIKQHFFCFRVWWAMFCLFGQWYQTCLACACVPRLLSGLYWHSLQHQYVWWSNDVWWCLVAKHLPFGQAFRRTLVTLNNSGTLESRSKRIMVRLHDIEANCWWFFRLI